MFNIIRAELYRILKGRGLKVLVLSLLILSGVFIILGDYNTNKDVIISTYSKQPWVNLDEILAQVNKPINLNSIDGFQFGAMMFGVLGVFMQPIHGVFNVDALDYFNASIGVGIFDIVVLGICNIVFLGDYKSKSYKNIISYGISKSQYYFAKYITTCIVIFISLFILRGSQLLYASIKYGYVGGFNNQILSEIIIKFLATFIAYCGLASMYMALSCCIKNKEYFIGIATSFFIAAPILLGIVLGQNTLLTSAYTIIAIVFPKFQVAMINNPYVSLKEILGVTLLSLISIIITLLIGNHLFSNKYLCGEEV